MRRLSVEVFQKFWSQVEKSASLMDARNVAYTERQEGKQSRCGLRHQITGLRHGIVRQVKLNGEIVEASFKDGKFHGLQRYVNAKEVIFSLWKDDSEIAYVGLDKKFKKTD